MRKFAALLVLVAVPATAQDAAPWQVSAQGRICTAVQGVPDAESGRLTIGYDAAREEVMLTGATDSAVAVPPGGRADLYLVFLDNGREKYDDQWAKRTFTYARDGGRVMMTTRFAGKGNVAQIFSDLAHSKRIGMSGKAGGPAVVAYFLDGLAPALPRLKACAERAANS